MTHYSRFHYISTKNVKNVEMDLLIDNFLLILHGGALKFEHSNDMELFKFKHPNVPAFIIDAEMVYN